MKSNARWFPVLLLILFSSGACMLFARPVVPVTGEKPTAEVAPATAFETYSQFMVSGENGISTEELMAYLSEESELELKEFTRAGSEVIAGKENMQRYFQELRKANARFERHPLETKDSTRSYRGYLWCDWLDRMDIAPLEILEEVTVRDGEIVKVVWTPTPEARGRLITAMTSIDPPESNGSLNQPCERLWATLNYLPEDGRMVMVGGGRLADAWLFQPDQPRWSLIPVRRVPSIDRIAGIYGAYDARVQRMIVLVYEGEGNSLETWSFDPRTGEWQNLNPSNSPSGRRFTTLVYDARADKSVLFGGTLSEDMTQVSAETWIFDYPTRSWQLSQPEISPPPLYFHHMVYDANPGRVLLWGGQPKEAVDHLVWSYDTLAGRWSRITYEQGPKADYDGAMAYSWELDRTFLYVGTQFWSYDDNANRWEKIDALGGPGRRLGISLAYHEQEHHLYLFGGAGEDLSMFTFGPHDGAWDRVAP